MSSRPRSSIRARTVGRPEHPAAVPVYLDLTFKLFEDDGVFVAECIELEVASQGETEGGALDAALDATALYLNTLEEEGIRAAVFSERGLRPEPLGNSTQRVRRRRVTVGVDEGVIRRRVAVA